MNEDLIELRRAVYRFFADQGRAPNPEEVGGRSADFAALEREHAVVLDAGGRLVFSNPFAEGPTEYEVRSGARRWWAVCAWDALGILAALDRSGSVRARCPDCGESLTLEVSGGALRPSDAVAHFLVPAARWYDDLPFT